MGRTTSVRVFQLSSRSTERPAVTIAHLRGGARLLQPRLYRPRSDSEHGPGLGHPVRVRHVRSVYRRRRKGVDVITCRPWRSGPTSHDVHAFPTPSVHAANMPYAHRMTQARTVLRVRPRPI